MDSCLNDLLPYWINTYNKIYDDSLKASDITDWNTSKFVKPECGKDIFKLLLAPEFFRHIPVIPDSQRVVEWLSTFDNVELYVVTAYTKSTCEDKADWLAEHFPCIKQENIIFINDKSLVDIDYLIDDSPYNCNGFKGKYILMDYPYNRQFGDKYTRVFDWQGVMDYFKEVFENNEKFEHIDDMINTFYAHKRLFKSVTRRFS